MKESAERFKSERGFTLIEMIAALTVFAMIAGIISGVTMFGFRSYHNIRVENTLREDADLIMSSIITELYTYGPERVQNTTGGIELIKSGSTAHLIQVKSKGIIINGNSTASEYGSPIAISSDTSDSTITATTSDGRLCSTNSLCDSGLIVIKLVLKYDGNEEDRMELESQFGF